MNPKVDFFFNKAKKWKEAYEQLRMILLNSSDAGEGLTEALKWGVPCYAYQGKNVVLMHGFKEYCALLFHKGVLMKDPEGILIQQTLQVQSARQIRFTSARGIIEMMPVLKAYIQEAIAVEKSGLKVELKKTSAFTMPEEFQQVLSENPDLKSAFESLTPGRQRGYLLYFSQAKQVKTRESRIEKYMQHILDGKGLDDV